MKQKLTELKDEIDISTVIPGEFNTPLSKWVERYFPGGTVVKNSPANAGDTGLSPGPGRSHMPRSN